MSDTIPPWNPPTQSEVASGPSAEAQVLIGIQLDPPRQNRWSVAFRGILAIPLFFVGFGLSIAGFFVVIAAWFASLFTGRVPDGMQSFLTKIVRFEANLYAYVYFLAPRWPGVPFDPRDNDQVTISVDHAELNRAAVFFRLILAVPAGVVLTVVQYGAYLLAIIMWFAGIILGREPQALHQAMAALLRYQCRYYCYFGLLSPTQPWGGLFGDEVIEAPTLTEPAPVLPASELPTRFVITKPSRVWIIIAIVAGAISMASVQGSANVNVNVNSNSSGNYGAVQVAPAPSSVL